MDIARASPIDVVEAAYDLRSDAAEWLSGLSRASRPLLSGSLGCSGVIMAGQASSGEPLIAQMSTESEPPNPLPAFLRGAQEAWPLLEGHGSAIPGEGVLIASEAQGVGANVYRCITQHLRCEDVLGLWALDAGFHGVSLQMPSAHRIGLSPTARDRWRTICAHIASAHRLRRRLGYGGDDTGIPLTEIPLHADAVIDPLRFRLVEARGPIKERTAADALRTAALRVDEARGKARRNDPKGALEIWTGLVCGDWSLVDWFDKDGRRYILAMANPTDSRDPRGLSSQERRVATLASSGQSSKVICHELGLSEGRVSMLLASAKRKLGVRTQAQLVLKMRSMNPGATVNERSTSDTN
jgi:DNA-binding CsgD family transcriptional regulator